MLHNTNSLKGKWARVLTKYLFLCISFIVPFTSCIGNDSINLSWRSESPYFLWSDDSLGSKRIKLNGQKYRIVNRIQTADASKLHNNQINAFISKGKAYMKGSNCKDAVIEFTKVIEIDAEAEEAYWLRANCYLVMDMNEKAIADLNKSSANEDRFPILYIMRAPAYYSVGKYQESIHDYSMFIKHVPDGFGTYERRGDAYLELKETKKAIDDYVKALVNFRQIQLKLLGENATKGESSVETRLVNKINKLKNNSELKGSK